MSQPDVFEAVLDALDKASDEGEKGHPRPAGGRRWRKTLKVRVAQPGGDLRSIEVVTRTLSTDRITFVHDGFLHPGSHCVTKLITVDNTWVDVQAVVTQCRLLSGRVHESAAAFDEPLDDSLFVARQLAASILLTDDARDHMRLTEHFLTKAGAMVVTTNSGSQALELTARQKFDLVLLDVEMPELSGPEVARSLRERGVLGPILAYTAHDDPTVHEECLEAGCNEVLKKPLAKQDLLDALSRYLGSVEPIVSKHAGDPEMAEFIHEFVVSLPPRVKELEEALEAEDAKGAGPLARQLMAIASDDGGCGFSALSEAADALAHSVTDANDWPAAKESLEALQSLSTRVRETGA